MAEQVVAQPATNFAENSLTATANSTKNPRCDF